MRVGVAKYVRQTTIRSSGSCCKCSPTSSKVRSDNLVVGDTKTHNRSVGETTTGIGDQYVVENRFANATPRHVVEVDSMTAKIIDRVSNLDYSTAQGYVKKEIANKLEIGYSTVLATI